MNPIAWALAAPGAAIVAWRIHAAVNARWSMWLAIAVSLIAIGLSLALNLRRTMAGQAGTPLRLAAVAGLGALVAFSALIDVVWECGSACDGTAAYASVLGIPAEVLAGSVLALIAIVVAAQAHQTRIQAGVEVLAWACVGAACYYLILSLSLGLVCPRCLAVHSVILCMIPALITGGSLRAPSRLAVIALAALALHATYHPISDAAAPPSPAGAMDAEQLRMFSKIDLGRRYGDPQAPIQAEMYLGLHCPHCRDSFPDLMRMFEPAIASGRVHLVIRPYYQDADGVRRLTKLSLMAAASGRLRPFLESMLGTPPGADDSALGANWAGLGKLLDDFTPAVDAILSADAAQQRRLQRHTEIPSVLLLHHGSSKPYAVWPRDLDLPALERAIARVPIGL
ncbi:MAG: thioredoxin domain-containing protein [Planctomycetota bacterium]|nr:thioredoxin domain-containing protein [Planctomycetota bacterium]